MRFYTSFFRIGNSVKIRGYEGEFQFFETHKLTPSHYLVDNSDNKSDITSFYDHKLKEVKFDTAWEAKNFCKENKDIMIFGYPNYEYTKIAEMFSGEYNSKLVRKAIIDIETLVGDDQDGNPENYDAFPNVEDPNHAVSLITTILGNEVFVYGLDYKWNLDTVKQHIIESLPADNRYSELSFVFKDYKTDMDLLKDFILLIEKTRPDIISGWNSNGFDIPYLCSRIKKLLGEDAYKRLSPFNLVEPKMVKTKFGKDQLEYNIQGIEQLDYLELYKKFELSPRENYKLETISQLELGAGKLDYTGSFQNFYKNDWDRFVAYNIVDVLLVDELDRKLGFIEIAMAMAYSALCVFTDVFRVTRIWDNIIANYCRELKIHVPTDYNNKRAAFEGAYVKPTIPGKYAVVAAFDVASLYPNIIVQNNISPERMLPENEFMPLSAKDVIELNDRYEHAFDNAKRLNATLCANGALFDKSKQGIIPQLIEIYIAKRKSAKKEMKLWGNKLEAAKLLLQQFT